MSLVGRLKVIADHRDLLAELVRKDFDARYAGSFLGLLWTQLYPLLLWAVYLFVFSVILPTEIPRFPLFLFIGIVLWQFFSTAVLLSANSIVVNANLVSRVAFPRELVTISVVLIVVLDLVMSHTVLALGALVYGIPVAWSWMALPLLVLLLALFCTGLGLMLATATVYLRDVRFFTEVGVLLLMFLSGLFYSEAQLPEAHAWMMKVNPLALAISAYRHAFLDAAWPEPMTWIALAGMAALVLWLGSAVFERYQGGFVHAL